MKTAERASTILETGPVFGWQVFIFVLNFFTAIQVDYGLVFTDEEGTGSAQQVIRFQLSKTLVSASLFGSSSLITMTLELS